MLCKIIKLENIFSVKYFVSNYKNIKNAIKYIKSKRISSFYFPPQRLESNNLRIFPNLGFTDGTTSQFITTG